MSEQNNFRAASLTGSLLARKGAALPAGPHVSGLDALAKDMAHDLAANRPVRHDPPTPVSIAPAQPAPVAAAAPLEQPEDGAPAEAVRPSKPRAASGSSGKAALTVRLDPERHFKLRLLSAHINRSSQQIMIDALDAFLQEHGADISPHMCACATAIS